MSDINKNLDTLENLRGVLFHMHTIALEWQNELAAEKKVSAGLREDNKSLNNRIEALVREINNLKTFLGGRINTVHDNINEKSTQTSADFQKIFNRLRAVEELAEIKKSYDDKLSELDKRERILKKREDDVAMRDQIISEREDDIFREKRILDEDKQNFEQWRNSEKKKIEELKHTFHTQENIATDAHKPENKDYNDDMNV